MSAMSPETVWRKAGAAPIRILMVDDSLVMRSIIERLLDSCADIELVGKTATASGALSFLAENQVDIVLLDHEMPSRKGLDALPDIIGAAKGAHVVMLSSHCQRGSETAVAALSMGASDAIAKPSRGHSSVAFGEDLVRRLRRLAQARSPRPVPNNPIGYRPFPDDFDLKCIGIGASTGGIHTLQDLLSGMRTRPGVPILVTQHLPDTFIPYYARQVARMCDMPVSVARAGEIFLPDHIYIAPGDCSLACSTEGNRARAILVPQRDPVTNARPSVNIMFSAMADCFGKGALGIVLTGIGRDGTAGAGAIVDTGGAVIAQDQESSVVWGMPGSVTRAGLACASLKPKDMFDYIRDHDRDRP